MTLLYAQEILRERPDGCSEALALCTEVAKAFGKSVGELFPTLAHAKSPVSAGVNKGAVPSEEAVADKCPYNHSDPDFVTESCESEPWATRFEAKGKYFGAKCRACKKKIPSQGDGKPCSDCPAYVCKHAALYPHGSCFGDAFMCPACYRNALLQTSGRARRRRSS